MNADARMEQKFATAMKRNKLAEACHAWGVKNQPHRYYRNFTGGFTRKSGPPAQHHGDPR